MSDPQSATTPTPVEQIDLEHEAELVQEDTADGEDVPDTSDEIEQSA